MYISIYIYIYADCARFRKLYKSYTWQIEKFFYIFDVLQ